MNQSTKKPKYMKRLPKDLDEWLKEPLSLAIWYMDDGIKRNDCNAGRIASQGFTLDEQYQLKDCIWKNFSVRLEVETWYAKSNADAKPKARNGLAIPSKGGHFNRWCDLIRPFVLPEFSYKLKLETP